MSRLKALKEEEERRLEIEEDEMLYTYPREDAYNQVKKKLAARKKAAELAASKQLAATKRTTGRRSNVKIEDEDDDSEEDEYEEEDESVEEEEDIDEESDESINIAPVKTPRARGGKVVQKKGPVKTPKAKISPRGRGRPPKPKEEEETETNITVGADEDIQQAIANAKLKQKQARLAQNKPSNFISSQLAEKAQASINSKAAMHSPVTKALAKKSLTKLAEIKIPSSVVRAQIPQATQQQPQLLSPSQLQHLKLILSKAHQNLHQNPGQTPNPQPGIQLVNQGGQPRPNIVSPSNPPIRQVIPQLNSQTFQQVLRQVSGVQTVNVGGQQMLAAGQHLHIVNPGQSVASAVQFVPQSLQVQSPLPAIQQVAGQPPMSFLKVSGQSSTGQPVLQYCMSPTVQSGVRLQTTPVQPQGVAPQGMVLLQLADGKAIPVSMSSLTNSNLNFPMTRMVGARTVVQQANSIPRFRLQNPQQPVMIQTPSNRPAVIPHQIIQQANTVVQTRTILQPPHVRVPTPAKLPTSRFVNANNVIKRSSPVSQTLKVPVAAPVVQASQSPVANHVSKDAGSPNVPPPWSNPNLVIRTRRANTNQAPLTIQQIINNAQKNKSITPAVNATVPRAVNPVGATTMIGNSLGAISKGSLTLPIRLPTASSGVQQTTMSLPIRLPTGAAASGSESFVIHQNKIVNKANVVNNQQIYFSADSIPSCVGANVTIKETPPQQHNGNSPIVLDDNG